MSKTAVTESMRPRYKRLWGGVGVLLGIPVAVLLILYGIYAWNYLLLFKIGPLVDLRAIEVTWRGQRIGHWDDPACLRQFRASLPRWTEEMGGSRCGEGSVTILHLRMRHGSADLELPVDDCAAINGGEAGQGYCFVAPDTLRLVGSWLAAAPEDMNRLAQESSSDELTRYQYASLRRQVRWWATGQLR